MAETFAARKTKLLQIQAMVTELIEMNNRGERLETELLAAGITTAEIGNTVNKIPTHTISDRVINLINSAITGGLDWSYSPTT
jgi:hypothetical protein